MREEAESGGVLPPGAARRFIRSRSSRARPIPSTREPSASPQLPPATLRNSSARSARHPAVPCKCPPPGTQDTSALRGEDQESWSAPTPTPTSLSGGSRWSRYPSRPLLGPIGASGQERLQPNRARLPVRMRQLDRTCFPRVFRSPSRRPYVAPSSGREETLRQSASLATALVPRPYRTPSICRLSVQAALNSSSHWDHGPSLSSLQFTSPLVPVLQTSRPPAASPRHLP